MLSEQRIREEIKRCGEELANLKEQVAKCTGLHEVLNLVEMMENNYRRIAILTWVLGE